MTTTQDDFAGLVRVREALSKMPYGGSVYITPGHVQTLDHIADYLVQLADVLAEVAEHSETEHNELAKLRAQKEAVREYLTGSK